MKSLDESFGLDLALFRAYGILKTVTYSKITRKNCRPPSSYLAGVSNRTRNFELVKHNWTRFFWPFRTTISHHRLTIPMWLVQLKVVEETPRSVVSSAHVDQGKGHSVCLVASPQDFRPMPYSIRRIDFLRLCCMRGLHKRSPTRASQGENDAPPPPSFTPSGVLQKAVSKTLSKT